MNAREEFINHIGSRVVLCAQIQIGEDYGDNTSSTFNLTTGWDSEDWNKFLSCLNFQYDSDYGIQNLNGIIWYKDGTWSDRGEYDGSEWWNYNYCPGIPTELNRLDKVREQKLNQILCER
jgi:hypothetical protein